MLSLLCVTSAALAAPVAHHEFPGVALTVPAGELQLHPLPQSSYGVTDKVTVRSAILGLLGGPNAGALVGLFDSEQGVGAVSLDLATTWDLSVVSGTASGLYTLGDPAHQTLSATVGVGVSRISVADESAMALSVPVSGTWLRSLNDHSVLRLYGQLDPLTTVVSRSYNGVLGGEWAYGWDRGRLGLGLVVVRGQVVRDVLDDAGVDSTWVPVLLPLPTLRLWWCLGGSRA